MLLLYALNSRWDVYHSEDTFSCHCCCSWCSYCRSASPGLAAVVRAKPTGEVGDVTGPVVCGQQPALHVGLGPEGPGLALRAGEREGDNGQLLLVRLGYLRLQ